MGKINKYKTFIPIYGWGYEWNYHKPSELKLLYHILISSAILLIPISFFIRWFLNIA